MKGLQEVEELLLSQSYGAHPEWEPRWSICFPPAGNASAQPSVC